MRGKIVFNGNGGGELIERVAPLLKAADGGSPQVLLVTAAWGPGEYGEGGIKEALYGQGVRPRMEGGFDQAVTNLCAWHVWSAFLQRRPDVARVCAEVDAARSIIRGWYQERTRFDAEMVRQAAALSRQRSRRFRLGALGSREPIGPDAVRSGAELVTLALGREILASVETLVQNDVRGRDGEDVQGEPALAARRDLDFADVHG